MSDARERQQLREDLPREEAALPVASDASSGAANESSQRRRTMLRVIGGTVAASLVMSGVLENAGWQIVFRDMPAPHAAIPLGQFLRGTFDTLLGAVGVGAGCAAAAMLLPSSWRKTWRRLPAAFALGAGAFLTFLSLLTFGFFR